MPLNLKKREDREVAIGMYIVLVTSVAGVFFLIKNLSNTGVLTKAIFDYAEIVGLVGLTLLVLQVTTDVRDYRPFTWVPADGRWWEYVVLGSVAAIRGLFILSSSVAALIILPILVPIKVIYKYTLSPSASLWSALLAVPMVVLCTSFAFTLLYFFAAVTKRGDLSTPTGRLFDDTPYGPPLLETFHFSLKVMLGRDDGQVKPARACQWILFAQLFAVKIIDILIVGVGIALIVSKFGSSPLIK